MSLSPYTRDLGPFRGWDLRPSSRAVFPPVDAYRDDEGLVVTLEVPGTPPEKLSIETQGRTLVIKAQAAEEDEGSKSYREFSRSFQLPADVDAERAEAKYEHGILSVRVPRSEAHTPRQIEVKVH